MILVFAFWSRAALAEGDPSAAWDRRPPLPDCWEKSEHWQYKIDEKEDGGDLCILHRTYRTEPVGFVETAAPLCPLPFSLQVVKGGHDQCAP